MLPRPQRLPLLAALIATLLLASLPAGAEQPLRFVTGAGPLAAWARQMGDGRVQAETILPRGRAPAGYALPESRVPELARARAFLLAGLPGEDIWLAALRRENPGLAAINLRTGLTPRDFPRDRRLAVLSPCGDAPPSAPTPYVWTAPSMAAVMLANLRGALAGLDPAGAAAYRRGYNRLAGRLEGIAEDFRRRVRRAAPRREFLASRPGLGWLAADLGLDMLLVHADDDSPLSGWELRCIVSYAARRRFPVLFIRPGFPGADAQTVAAAVGAQLVTADPLARDWLGELDRLSRVLPPSLR